MTIEAMETFLGFSRVATFLEQAVWFGSHFVWGAGFYILYRLYKLRFTLLLIWAEATGLVSWFWFNRVYFFSNLMVITEHSSDEHIVLVSLVEIFMRLTPLFLGTTGAIIGLAFLWKKLRTAGSANMKGGAE